MIKRIEWRLARGDVEKNCCEVARWSSKQRLRRSERVAAAVDVDCPVETVAISVRATDEPVGTEMSL